MSGSENADSIPALIVTTSEDSGDVVGPSARGIHLCQPWRPMTCWCTVRHEPFDAALLTVFVGVPEPTLQPCPRARAFGVVPNGRDRPLPYARVVAARGQAWAPFATVALRNLVDGFTLAGLIGYDFADWSELIAPSVIFGLVSAEGPGSLVEVGRPVVDEDRFGGDHSGCTWGCA